MTKPISNDELERVRSAAVAGKKIEAIKLYRVATGTGLAEAKRAVEALEAGQTRAASIEAVSNDDVDQIEAALFAGQKIQAIRLYRNATGEGLKESRDFIEAVEAELRRTDPTRFTAPAAKGCGATVLCLLAMLGVLAGIAAQLGESPDNPAAYRDDVNLAFPAVTAILRASTRDAPGGADTLF